MDFFRKFRQKTLVLTKTVSTSFCNSKVNYGIIAEQQDHQKFHQGLIWSAGLYLSSGYQGRASQQMEIV